MSGARVAVGTVELHLPDVGSLKGKRHALKGLKETLRRRFEISVAEVDHHDVWQRSVIGVVTLSNEEKHVRESLQRVLDEADRILGSFLIDQKFEIV